MSTRSFEDFQRELDRAISVSHVAHLLRHSWTNHTMSIAGPGAHGSLRYREGRVDAELHIGFPASMLKPRIVGDIRRMLETAAGASVAVTG